MSLHQQFTENLLRQKKKDNGLSRNYLECIGGESSGRRWSVQYVKDAFSKQIKGAKSKELLVRDEDVQVLHGFASAAEARACLDSDLFTQDVVGELQPYLAGAPEVRSYDVA